MHDGKITYGDLKEYEGLFSLAPSFLLERFAKKNTNLVLKFNSKVNDFLAKLNEDQKSKLDIVLNTEIEHLQAIMADAYQKSNKKQYKILANPKYRQFIELNINEIRKIVND